MHQKSHMCRSARAFAPCAYLHHFAQFVIPLQDEKRKPPRNSIRRFKPALLLPTSGLQGSRTGTREKLEENFTEGTERAAIAPSGSRRFRFVMETLPA
jgi:hypothetical protein